MSLLLFDPNRSAPCDNETRHALQAGPLCLVMVNDEGGGGKIAFYYCYVMEYISLHNTTEKKAAAFAALTVDLFTVESSKVKLPATPRFIVFTPSTLTNQRRHDLPFREYRAYTVPA